MKFIKALAYYVIATIALAGTFGAIGFTVGLTFAAIKHGAKLASGLL